MSLRERVSRCTARCRACGHCYIGFDMALCRSLPACVYILDTGRRRPCPAGDGCTEFTPLSGAEERRRRAAAAMWRGIRARPDGGAGDGR